MSWTFESFCARRVSPYEIVAMLRTESRALCSVKVNILEVSLLE